MYKRLLVWGAPGGGGGGEPGEAAGKGAEADAEAEAEEKYVDKVRQDLDDLLDGRAQQLTQEQWGEVFVDFFRDNGRTPFAREKVDEQNIGAWYNTQKQKVTSKGDEAYERLMGLGRAAGLGAEVEEQYADVVRQSLDALLEGRAKQLTPEQWGEVFVKFVRDNGCTPSLKDKFDGENIWNWYETKKGKVKSKGDEAYERLMGLGRAAGLDPEAEEKYADEVRKSLDALLEGRAQREGRDTSNTGTT
jgi:hypothetical protein